MPSVPRISKRMIPITYDSGSARWAFFAIFLVLIIIVVLGTLRANKKRSQRGAQPIYGTRWMTPPSYRQSQTQYNQPNDPEMPLNYVPMYSERANEYDMGYYDAEGVFHSNPNAKKAPIPEVHQRTTSMSQGVPLTEIPSIDNDEDDLYRRPPGPPPRGSDVSDVGPPPGPPTQTDRSNTNDTNSTAGNITPDSIGPPDEPPSRPH